MLAGILVARIADMGTTLADKGDTAAVAVDIGDRADKVGCLADGSGGSLVGCIVVVVETRLVDSCEVSCLLRHCYYYRRGVGRVCRHLHTCKGSAV